MTCIIGLEHNGKIYMGCDSRRSYPQHLNKPPIDSDEPKILRTEKLMIGFAGSAGLQDLGELLIPAIDIANLDFETLTQKCCNILSLFKNSNVGSILISDGKTIKYIDTGGVMFSLTDCIDNFIVIGTGLPEVKGSMHSSSKTDPIERIKEAITVVSKYYSGAVGGEIKVFTLT